MKKRSSKLSSLLLITTALMFSISASAEIKIGFIGPMTGTQAVQGLGNLDGFRLGLDMRGGKLGGQEVKLITGDDQLKPEVAVQVVRQFIGRDNVDAIIGLGFSNILMSTLPRLKESEKVSIALIAGPSPMAGASCAPNVFSAAHQNDGYGESIGKMMQNRGYKNVYLMAPNYQAGKDMLEGFKRFYKGNIVGEVYTQLSQTDYSAEITQLQAENPDALFMFYSGGMGVNFTKQLSQAGITKKLPVYSVFTVDGSNLPALQDTALGIVSGNIYSPTLDNPANKKFVAEFQKKYDELPDSYSAVGYDAASILDIAIASLDGDVSDQKAFAKAVHDAGAKFESVRGPFRFNNNNMPIQNYYAFQIVKEDGELKSKLIDTPLPEHQDSYHQLCPL
ncbi:ABC transporter substrate-binding protein [Eoetvoesiella caeni]|uniref:Branched-chain amino acid transport system substrate-binding protein n=1 Tax=Eoetvoesiella caeni TaxID=645616 RepID=A0A366H0F4_9BURK|nr:ABC transporter substrate-binding protein [Eoetvoesiella caeni]MCI2811358.1 ABC transporter substrate-binding protein [Eoetvoesiella caeni]NYT57261.1 ABC transporter substrate-binding protein [Eoetvoesiella caeni]RBP34977.1 branched-chain amino acid transport system substrate-binding protein [Eoetvoesiella caeni]